MSKLKKMGLFATPESVELLTEYVTRYSNDGERMVAVTVMGMTWNLCAELTDPPITARDEEVMSIVYRTLADMGGAELGKKIKEALGETNHTGWEGSGYSREGMLAVKAFIQDIL